MGVDWFQSLFTAVQPSCTAALHRRCTRGREGPPPSLQGGARGSRPRAARSRAAADRRTATGGRSYGAPPLARPARWRPRASHVTGAGPAPEGAGWGRAALPRGCPLGLRWTRRSCRIERRTLWIAWCTLGMAKGSSCGSLFWPWK